MAGHSLVRQVNPDASFADAMKNPVKAVVLGTDGTQANGHAVRFDTMSYESITTGMRNTFAANPLSAPANV